MSFGERKARLLADGSRRERVENAIFGERKFGVERWRCMVARPADPEQDVTGRVSRDRAFCGEELGPKRSRDV
jgi:hypothetical protein